MRSQTIYKEYLVGDDILARWKALGPSASVIPTIARELGLTPRYVGNLIRKYANGEDIPHPTGGSGLSTKHRPTRQEVCDLLAEILASHPPLHYNPLRQALITAAKERNWLGVTTLPFDELLDQTPHLENHRGITSLITPGTSRQTPALSHGTLYSQAPAAPGDTPSQAPAAPGTPGTPLIHPSAYYAAHPEVLGPRYEDTLQALSERLDTLLRLAEAQEERLDYLQGLAETLEERLTLGPLAPGLT